MSQIQENDATISEVLLAVSDFSTQVDKRFSHLDGNVQSLQKDNIHFKNVMVTKEYLDDKLFDLRGDLVTMIRKEDTKVTKLVSILSDRKVITSDEAQQIMLVTN